VLNSELFPIWWRFIIRSRIDLGEPAADSQIVLRQSAIPFDHGPTALVGSFQGEPRLRRP